MRVDDGSLTGEPDPAATDRFAALSATFDGLDARPPRRLGLRAGWTCWEVGAGGPAVPSWLAERVGPTGRVVATDLDTSWLPAERPVQRPAPRRGHRPAARRRLRPRPRPPRADPRPRPRRGAAADGRRLATRRLARRSRTSTCRSSRVPAPTRRHPRRTGPTGCAKGSSSCSSRRGVDLTFGRTLRRRLLGLGPRPTSAPRPTPRSPSRPRAASRSPTPCRCATGLEALGCGDDVEPTSTALAAGRIDVATPPLVTAWGRPPAEPCTAFRGPENRTERPRDQRGRLSWGERNRTPNYRTRICCVASYTTPHGAVRECRGGRSDVLEPDEPAERRRRPPPAARAPTARRPARRWSASVTRGRRARPRSAISCCAGRGTGR